MKVMANPFQLITEMMADLGLFSFFLPWIITAAVMWGLLKRSKMFDPSINAILSIAVSFFIWGFLARTAFDMGGPLATFITQGFVFMLVFVVSLVGASMFYPKFSETLNAYDSYNNMREEINGSSLASIRSYLSGASNPLLYFKSYGGYE